MKLGELKKSLARISPDLDDVEVLINFVGEDGKSDYDNLGFTAYTELPDVGIVCILGTAKEACERIKQNTLHYPDGSSPDKKSFGINE